MLAVVRLVSKRLWPAMEGSFEEREVELRRIARRRAKEKLLFYLHAAVYVAVNAVLLAINLSLAPESLWFYWPLAGWGIGLAAHAVATYRFDVAGALQQRLEERELEKLRRRE